LEFKTPESIMEEEKIHAAVALARPSVAVVGLGGAGSNIVSWIKARGIAGGKLVAANTDAAHLSITKADRRILLGEKLCHGMGCGGYADRGRQAANESLDELTRELRDSRIVFLCAGLGGGTGTGAIEVFAQALRGRGPLVIGVVTLPFTVEKYRYELARDALRSIKDQCDTVVAIDNTKLAKVAGNLPLQEALGVANELVGQFVKGTTETITTASLINIDYADVRAIMEKHGLAAIGVGQHNGGSDRIESAVRRALDTQLLDIRDLSKSKGVLVHVTGGEDITLDEVTRAGELVTRSLPPKIRIVWGARVEPAMKGQARVMVVLTGVDSTFLEEHKKPLLGLF